MVFVESWGFVYWLDMPVTTCCCGRMMSTSSDALHRHSVRRHLLYPQQQQPSSQEIVYRGQVVRVQVPQYYYSVCDDDFKMLVERLASGGRSNTCRDVRHSAHNRLVVACKPDTCHHHQQQQHLTSPVARRRHMPLTVVTDHSLPSNAGSRGSLASTWTTCCCTPTNGDETACCGKMVRCRSEPDLLGGNDEDGMCAIAEPNGGGRCCNRWTTETSVDAAGDTDYCSWTPSPSDEREESPSEALDGSMPTLSAALTSRQSVPRTVVLKKNGGTFGFVLCGAKSRCEMTFTPTVACPALQYLDSVQKGSVAEKAGLAAGDFLLEINGQNVVSASHLQTVKLIKQAGDVVYLKILTPSSRRPSKDSPITPPSRPSTAPPPSTAITTTPSPPRLPGSTVDDVEHSKFNGRNQRRHKHHPHLPSAEELSQTRSSSAAGSSSGNESVASLRQILQQSPSAGSIAAQAAAVAVAGMQRRRQHANFPASSTETESPVFPSTNGRKLPESAVELPRESHHSTSAKMKGDKTTSEPECSQDQISRRPSSPSTSYSNQKQATASPSTKVKIQTSDAMMLKEDSNSSSTYVNISTMMSSELDQKLEPSTHIDTSEGVNGMQSAVLRNQNIDNGMPHKICTTSSFPDTTDNRIKATGSTSTEGLTAVQLYHQPRKVAPPPPARGTSLQSVHSKDDIKPYSFAKSVKQSGDFTQSTTQSAKSLSRSSPNISSAASSTRETEQSSLSKKTIAPICDVIDANSTRAQVRSPGAVYRTTIEGLAANSTSVSKTQATLRNTKVDEKRTMSPTPRPTVVDTVRVGATNASRLAAASDKKTTRQQLKRRAPSPPCPTSASSADSAGQKQSPHSSSTNRATVPHTANRPNDPSIHHEAGCAGRRRPAPGIPNNTSQSIASAKSTKCDFLKQSAATSTTAMIASRHQKTDTASALQVSEAGKNGSLSTPVATSAGDYESVDFITMAEAARQDYVRRKALATRIALAAANEMKRTSITAVADQKSITGTADNNRSASSDVMLQSAPSKRPEMFQMVGKLAANESASTDNVTKKSSAKIVRGKMIAAGSRRPAVHGSDRQHETSIGDGHPMADTNSSSSMESSQMFRLAPPPGFDD